jgi:predicted Zn finger-like uncharacterized protein
MSLATRCTSCDTVFRVVQDQLKVSEGWVRCGRCGEVFNALEGLFDLEPEPSPEPAPEETTEAPAATDLVLADEAPGSSVSLPDVDEPDELIAPTAPTAPIDEEPPFSSRPADFDATPAARVAARDRIDFADAQFNSELLAEAGIEVADEPDDAAAATPPPVAEPEFLRQAERQARWDQPRTVVALAVLCVVLALAVMLQVVVHYRDLLATLSPQARPVLQALCEMAACSVAPLRRIEDVVIESSALTSAPNGSAVRLSVVLRNRGPLPLAIPSIELTLTDPDGQMLVRRALSPADFGVTTATLPAASEAPLQLVMAISGRRATGYTVEPFYP